MTAVPAAAAPAWPWPLGAVASRRSHSQVRRVEPVRRPRPPVADLYATMRAELPLLAPVVLHAPSPSALTAAWALARETWLASAVPPQLREAAVAGISAANSCPYCEQTHSMFGAAASAGGDAELVRRYRAWGEATSHPRGAAPPSVEQAIDLAALAVGYHYVNRMVNVFLAKDQISLPRRLGRVRPLVEAAFTRVIARRLVAQSLVPGRAVELLPPAPLPVDLQWAAGEPRLAATLAGAAHLLDDGARHLSDSARRAVEQRVQAWQGQPPGLSRAWVEQALATVPDAERPPARLALLVALASYQVDDTTAAEARRWLGSDQQMIEVASWAAFLAARRVATWCAPEVRTARGA